MTAQGRLRPVGSALKNFAMVETGRSGGPTVAKVSEGREATIVRTEGTGGIAGIQRSPWKSPSPKCAAALDRSSTD
jgi:hypothetical protein